MSRILVSNLSLFASNLSLSLSLRATHFKHPNSENQLQSKSIQRYLKSVVHDCLTKRLRMGARLQDKTARALARDFVRGASPRELKNAALTKCRRINIREMVDSALDSVHESEPQSSSKTKRPSRQKLL